MTKRSKAERIEHSGHPCAWGDCRQPGDFRAPKSRHNLRDYQWLCEEHIAQFNKQWNYFEGMNQDEIYAYQRDAATGHRPTWRMDQLGRHAQAEMETAFNRLFGEGPASPAYTAPPISARNKDALAVLDLEHPSDKARIKAQYRELARKYHPDVNSGNPRTEEIFKNITRAYQQLMAHYVEA